MLAKEYRAYAIECLDSAKVAKSDSERDTFIRMAQDWLRAAALAEQANSSVSGVISPTHSAEQEGPQTAH
jgi:hypothetical protein